MKLRGYQREAVRSLSKLLAARRRVVAVAPTGSGKTVIGAHIVHAMKRKHVLWVAHRGELLQQARDALIASGLGPQEVGILSGPHKINVNARVLVAGINMFQWYSVAKADLIVIDECHHVSAASYLRLIGAHSEAMILGLTATPERLDGKPLGATFTKLHVIAEPEELIASRYLLKSSVYGMPREKAAALVKGVGQANRDYSPLQLERAMAKRPLMADIVTEWKRLGRGSRTIVYACTRKHGRRLAKQFRDAGVATAYLDAMTPPGERSALLGRRGLLASGKVRVVVNVGVLTEGFDCPPVGCIVVARPTKSLVLWRQMCGRGARPSGRKKFLVLDHAGNTWRHGFPDTRVEWSLDGRPKGNGAAPVRFCPACSAMNPLSARECCECGATLPVTPRSLTPREVELEKLRAREQERRAIVRRVEEMARAKRLGSEWVRKALVLLDAA